MHYTTLFISLHKDILDMDIETVDKFLKEFKDKARAFGIIFRIDNMRICKLCLIWKFRQLCVKR